MDNIDPDGFYDHTLTHLTEEQEERTWRFLKKRGLDDTLIPSMLGLIDSVEVQDKLSTYSRRMHATLRHSDDHVPAERFRALIDRLVNEGWTVAQIAEAAGSSRATVGRSRKENSVWVRREFVERLEAAA